MNSLYQFLFASLQAAIAPSKVAITPAEPFTEQEWKRIFSLAKFHGITAIVLDAVSQLSPQMQPPLAIKMQWIGMVANIEKRFHFQYDTAAEFAGIMSQHGIRTLVMKGLAFSTYYPKPEHRECGDLDCFLGDRFEEGNSIAEQNGARNDGGDYKHIHLNFKGLTIENHRYLTNFNATRRGKHTEKLLQHYIQMPSRNIGDTALQLPSAEFNALFLIKHAQKHFIDEGINLRHIFDWAALLKAEQENLDWKALHQKMQECHISHFADVMTEICHKYLGLDLTNSDIASTAHNPLTEAVLQDILQSHRPKLGKESIVGKAKRIFRRFVRMWRFRKVADENYATLIWNTFIFSSYIKRTPKL